MSEQNVNETANQQAENTNVGGNEETTDTTTEKVEEKTFSQEDVNNIATKEARKAQEKIFEELGIEDFENAKEGFKKFQEWQESQKTEQEKQQESFNKMKETNKTLSTENTSLKAQLSALKAGVNTDSVEDVVVLAQNLVSDEIDMDTAIKQVIEKYPHFAKAEQEQEEKPNFTTGQHQSNGNKNNDPFMAKLAKYK